MFGNSSLNGNQQQTAFQQQPFTFSPESQLLVSSFAGNNGNLKSTTSMANQPADSSITGSNVVAGSNLGQTSSISSNAMPTTFGTSTNSFGSFGSTSPFMAINMQSTTGSTDTPTGWGTTFAQAQQTLAFGCDASIFGFHKPAGGMINQNTAAVDFAPTPDRDMITGTTNLFQTITAMPQYKYQSLEELRLHEYKYNRRPQTTPGTRFETPPSGLPVATAPDFVPTIVRDLHTDDYTFYQSITAMAQYMHLSTEEIRLRDYQQNRKPQATATHTEFGTAQPSLSFEQLVSAYANCQPSYPPLFGNQTSYIPSLFGAGNQPPYGAMNIDGNTSGQQEQKTSTIPGQQPITSLVQQPAATFDQQSSSPFDTLTQQSCPSPSQQPAANTFNTQLINTTRPLSFGDVTITTTTTGIQGTTGGLDQAIDYQQQPTFGVTSLGTNTLQSTTVSVSFNLEIDIVQPGYPIKVSATVNGIPNTNGSIFYNGTLQQQHQQQHQPQIPEQQQPWTDPGSTISHQIEPAVEVKSEGVSQSPLVGDCAQTATGQKVDNCNMVSNIANSTRNDEYSKLPSHQHTTTSVTDTTQMGNLVAINEGYYCTPTLDMLEKLTPDQLKKVDGFSVGRHGVGKITFDQPVDISGLDLNKLLGYTIVLDNQWVSLYPDIESKPLLGDELNVTATVELTNCYVYYKDTKNPIRDPRIPRYRAFLERLRCKSGLGFINYVSSTGTWTFKINQC